jgi:hypothetical protein
MERDHEQMDWIDGVGDVDGDCWMRPAAPDRSAGGFFRSLVQGARENFLRYG